ncbi:Uncharacterized protein conserved in bacteria, putative virulence factor [Serratia rubidaea]|uniref:Uncharacterized protein conserved in bacteria, putative virulence factor n=1 Tax=Serratia rubidaea TaxID=61652 RepID=A0A447QUH9_SERRU|nr:Uncharacterized protein conserved in bacteria, putative virulence factor [Serratia rubidaea]
MDEATCGQMVYLYNETQVNFAGDSKAFFCRHGAPGSPADQRGAALRIASIDIGGGTSDLSVTQFSLDDGLGHNVKIIPQLLFREGFKLAGDDILLDVIQRYLLPALQQTLERAGVAHPAALMDTLFGNQGRLDGLSTRRQQTTLQLFMPLGRAILQAYEAYDPLDAGAELAATFGELLSQRPTTAYCTLSTRRFSASLVLTRRRSTFCTPRCCCRCAICTRRFYPDRSASPPACAPFAKWWPITPATCCC